MGLIGWRVIHGSKANHFYPELVEVLDILLFMYSRIWRYVDTATMSWQQTDGVDWRDPKLHPRGTISVTAGGKQKPSFFRII